MKLPIRIPYIDDKKLEIEGDDSEGILLHAKAMNNSFSFYLQKFVIDLCLAHNKTYKILNAGANLGLVCLPISFFCETIYAFEPLPNTFKYLQKNILTNNITNIQSFCVALGDTEGVLEMEPYGWDKKDKDSGHSIVTNRLYQNTEQYIAKPGTHTINVESKKIDSYNFDALDILLLDTEGYEPYVIDGSCETIKKHKPYIIIEHEVGHVQCRHMTSRSIIDKILNLGYEDVKIILPESSNKENYKLLSVEYDNDFLTIFKSYACVDLLFIPNNRKR